MRRLTLVAERWPLASAFVISRGTKTEAHVVVARIEEAGLAGRGEATPYGRYGETVEGVLAELESVRGEIEDGLELEALQIRLPPGAARNALDCALWDLTAKRLGRPAFTLAGLEPPGSVLTAYTISLGSADAMARAARAARSRPLLKLKIGGPDDLDGVRAVRQAAPESRLVVDANEALTFEDLRRLAPEFRGLGVELIEQPLAAGADEALEGYVCEVPLCADESAHTRRDLDLCAARYQAVNIKLDKAGGLTEALAIRREARARGLGVMAGCMVATSLAMAPALLLAQDADVIDLDGPLLLARDRDPGLHFTGSTIAPAPAALWG